MLAPAVTAVGYEVPGITREMIESALPVEGAPPAVPGPYAVTSEKAFNSPGLLVFRPTSLAAFPRKDTMPPMVWGNGGCAIDSTRYSGFLTTIASHGFLVMGTAAQEGAARRQATADDLRAAIDWAEKENAREGSPLKGKIALDNVAVMGQSSGSAFVSVRCAITPSANAAVIAAARTVRFIHASSRLTSPRANAPFESPRCVCWK
jgi:hypothetical protein